MRLMKANKGTPIDWWPEKETELVGRKGNFMVKYRVLNLVRSQGFVRLQVVGVQELPEGANDETPLDQQRNESSVPDSDPEGE